MRRDACPIALLALAAVLACGPRPLAQANHPSPQRIVSLAPSATEVLFEAGLGSRVVGVTSYCRFPREALALPKVGGYLTPSYEAIIRLDPDLVVLLPEHAEIEARLAALGVPTLRLDHRSLEGIIQSLSAAGERCGDPLRAAEAAELLRRDLAHARRAAPSESRPRVLVCFGQGDDFRRCTAAAPGTIHDDLITYAGGRNALTSRAVSYPTLSLESLLRLNPDVIVELSPGHPDASALRRRWEALASLTAVRTGRVYVFTDDFLSVPGPRFARFAGIFARTLFPR